MQEAKDFSLVLKIDDIFTTYVFHVFPPTTEPCPYHLLVNGASGTTESFGQLSQTVFTPVPVPKNFIVVLLLDARPYHKRARVTTAGAARH